MELYQQGNARSLGVRDPPLAERTRQVAFCSSGNASHHIPPKALIWQVLLKVARQNMLVPVQDTRAAQV